MDVMRPSLKWISGRCYRINPSTVTCEEEEDEADDDYRADGISGEDQYDSLVTCESDVNIESVQGGSSYRLEVDDIPTVYYKYIIGRKGDMKKQLEQETRTQLHIPKMGHDGHLVITASSRRQIMSCKRRLELIVQSARRKQPFTHFLSIPFTSPQILHAFSQFMQDVMDNCGQDGGIDASIFQSPQKLHLTIGTLVLLSGKERDRAAQLLHQCINDIVKPILSAPAAAAAAAHQSSGSLVVDVSGIEYMNDDPMEVDVLYAKVAPTQNNRLQQMADGIVGRFAEAGLMWPQSGGPGPGVKLHVTVMNSLFRAATDTATADTTTHPDTPHSRHRETFNANNILTLYGDYPFGEQCITSIHLSQRYSTGPDGYYTPTATAIINA